MRFAKFFSSDFEASSKRLAFLVLVAVFIIITFLLMYIKVEIANKDLLKEQLWYLFLLICIIGTYISAEWLQGFFNKRADAQMQAAKSGTPQTKVEVKTAGDIQAENVNIQEAKK
jgi:LytS/YehU family sensor histidine kinase